MAYLYRHIRLDKNEPFYIGIGEDSSKFINKYRRAYIKSDRNIVWKRITNKTQYEIEILLDDLTWEEACQKEIEFIKLYGRINIKTGILANLTDGGEGPSNLSLESREKISKGNRKPKPQISISKKGKKNSLEHNLHISLAQKGKSKHSIESRSLIGNKNRRSKPQSFIDKHSKAIYQYDLQNNFIKEWKSGKEASNNLNINYKSLNLNLNNHTKTSGGFIWKFKTK